MNVEPLKSSETHRISPFLHGVFGESIGTVIYDGTWVGKDSEIPNDGGVRRDVIEGFKEAGVTAIRWPGGCTADHYHWKDGVGPRRFPRMPFGKAQGKEFRHDFGTDEFIRFCRLTGAEPILVANVATGTPEEFQDWFEYCNGDASTKYGSLRAENGHPEPYRVTHWALGNTDENVWHAAFNDPEEYARNFRKWKTAIMGSLEGIKLIGLGLSERHEMRGWVESFLDYATSEKRIKGPDSLSVHHYIGGMKARYRECEGSVDFSDEACRFTLDALKAYQSDIDMHRKAIKEHTNPSFRTSICFDEWGLWHPEATDENALRQNQTMRDALFAACALHLFYRNSDIVEFAMETQYANVLQSLFETDGARCYKTPTFYVFKLFKEHLNQALLEVDFRSMGGDLDCIASIDDARQRIVLTVVNKDLHESRDLELSRLFAGYAGTRADAISPENVRDFNSFERPGRVKDGEIAMPDRSVVTVARHSVMRVILEREGTPVLAVDSGDFRSGRKGED